MPSKLSNLQGLLRKQILIAFWGFIHSSVKYDFTFFAVEYKIEEIVVNTFMMKGDLYDGCNLYNRT